MVGPIRFYPTDAYKLLASELDAPAWCRRIDQRPSLLRTPVGGDNAAMQTEPSKADPPKRKRRWFQFSLRTLMIGVTLLAIGSA